jgi:hypothetical protein
VELAAGVPLVAPVGLAAGVPFVAPVGLAAGVPSLPPAAGEPPVSTAEPDAPLPAQPLALAVTSVSNIARGASIAIIVAIERIPFMGRS